MITPQTLPDKSIDIEQLHLDKQPDKSTDINDDTTNITWQIHRHILITTRLTA